MRRNSNMTKEIKISNYSCYNNYTIKNEGENHSTIVTKMIHIAGRLCERFASDIVYDANAFIEAIENKENFDRYLFFRENGVTTLRKDCLDSIEGIDYIQVWHLTYNAETKEQEFTRVDIRFERKW